MVVIERWGDYRELERDIFGDEIVLILCTVVVTQV